MRQNVRLNRLILKLIIIYNSHLNHTEQWVLDPTVFSKRAFTSMSSRIANSDINFLKLLSRSL